MQSRDLYKRICVFDCRPRRAMATTGMRLLAGSRARACGLFQTRLVAALRSHTVTVERTICEDSEGAEKKRNT